jgi:hypothetical protein
MFANTTEDTDRFATNGAPPNHYDCVLDIIPKVYVNPERIFCEGETYYLSADDERVFPLHNLQCDGKGYFVELVPTAQPTPLEEFVLARRGPIYDSRCPLCKTTGYYGGVCKNPDCPGKENRRKVEEEKKRKKDEYKEKKAEEKKKKKK